MVASSLNNTRSSGHRGTHPISPSPFHLPRLVKASHTPPSYGQGCTQPMGLLRARGGAASVQWQPSLAHFHIDSKKIPAKWIFRMWLMKRSERDLWRTLASLARSKRAFEWFFRSWLHRATSTVDCYHILTWQNSYTLGLITRLNNWFLVPTL